MKVKKRIAKLKEELSKLEHKTKHPTPKTQGTVNEMLEQEKKIKELEARKEIISKKVEAQKSGKKGFGKFWTGFRGALAKGAVNKEINERRQIIGLNRRADLLKQQSKVAELQAQVNARRKAASIDYNQIFAKPVNTSPIKTISEKDIFG